MAFVAEPAPAEVPEAVVHGVAVIPLRRSVHDFLPSRVERGNGPTRADQRVPLK
jgi:hypothetical protein